MKTIALICTLTLFVLAQYCSGCRSKYVPTANDEPTHDICQDQAFPKDKVQWVTCHVEADVVLEQDIILCKCKRDAGQ